ncbi:MAG: SDR family oxidoreductase [Firmicutes bacterium]|nr:SDR family oxidoreductase [Bacillota bacterium]
MHVKEMFDLTGKTAVVTGGSIGLGAQMATALAEAGANLVVAARRVERCAELCEQLKQLGVKAIPAACDVSKPDDCQRLVDLTVKEFGTLDILVNNAGFTWGADSLNYPMDKWQQVLDVNLTGLFQLSAMAARVMKEQGRGKIINIASVAGFIGAFPESQNTVAYNASKGAVITLTKDLAVKWARYGIYVNAIAPGFFPSHMSEGILKKIGHLVVARVPLGRLGNDQDLKGAIVFLSSAASDYITGHCLIVDGGRLAV